MKESYKANMLCVSREMFANCEPSPCGEIVAIAPRKPGKQKTGGIGTPPDNRLRSTAMELELPLKLS